MKNYIKNFTLAVCATVMMIGAAGCTDSFEEINKDPDGAQVVPSDNVLAWVMYQTSYRFYDRWFALDEPMTFCGYISKMGYIDEARYQFRPGVQDSNWAYVYRILNNIRDIQAKVPAGSNSMNIANIMEAHVMLIATDRWRDVPYSDACRMGEGYLTPKYDKQEDIYPALLKLLEETANSMAAGYGDDDVSGGDIMFNGDMLRWQKYCNSLRLRMAIRLNEVSSALAKTTIESILTNPAKYPIMESNEDNALFWWNGSDSNYYEMVADAYRTRKTEFCAPDIMIDYMNNNEDPRIGVYFTPTPASVQAGEPKYVGYEIGAATAPPGGSSSRSVWGVKYGQDLGGFSPWMRVAEVYFIIAEAKHLGYNVGSYATSVEDAYNQGVKFSLTENGVSSEDTKAYMAGAGKFDGTIDQVWYEEWVAMFKQGMEGWSLYRRTGVPKTNHIASGRSQQYANHNVPPFRSPYPSTERNLNKTNCSEFSSNVVDDFWGQQLWWDTRKDVY